MQAAKQHGMAEQQRSTGAAAAKAGTETKGAFGMTAKDTFLSLGPTWYLLNKSLCFIGAVCLLAAASWRLFDISSFAADNCNNNCECELAFTVFALEDESTADTS